MVIGILLIVASLVLFYLFWRSTKSSNQSTANNKVTKDVLKANEQELQQIPKLNLGRIMIYFGTQTGTSSKMAEYLAEEATEKGFQPIIIDLQNISYYHFNTRYDISLFLISNTGYGAPPENALRFMRVLRNKEYLHYQKYVDWSKVYFAVFGLGNTQYYHFNKTGIDTDDLLSKRGAIRLFYLALGDANASLEDDFMYWRRKIWPILIEFRKQHPLVIVEDDEQPVRKVSTASSHEHQAKYVSQLLPVHAQYRLVYSELQNEYIGEDELEFKTKAYLKAVPSTVVNLHYLRQNRDDGSTIELEIALPGQPHYTTADNIALYPHNNPYLVAEVAEYFKLSPDALTRKLVVYRIKYDAKLHLPFFPNSTLQTILTERIDLQGKPTKSLLKKLGKLPSANQDYFQSNSSAKTTEEYKALTAPNTFNYLFKLVKQFEVQLSIEDFIELSDSIAPRLFTIASDYNVQKNVIVAVSLVKHGLMSYHVSNNPESIRAYLRRSTFTDPMRWNKVVFVATGTGFAPFRGFLQRKQYLLYQKMPVPEVSMYFGCKHYEGDFIYKETIQDWAKHGIINRLHLAFSRDGAQKIYVQGLLAANVEEIQYLKARKDAAIYVCGSMPMGHAVVKLLQDVIGVYEVKLMEEEGRVVKELW